MPSTASLLESKKLPEPDRLEFEFINSDQYNRNIRLSIRDGSPKGELKLGRAAFDENDETQNKLETQKKLFEDKLEKLHNSKDSKDISVLVIELGENWSIADPVEKYTAIPLGLGEFGSTMPDYIYLIEPNVKSKELWILKDKNGFRKFHPSLLFASIPAPAPAPQPPTCR